MSNLIPFIRGLYKKPTLVSEDYANAVFEALESGNKAFFGDDRELSAPEFKMSKIDSSGAQASGESYGVLLEIEGGLTYKRQLCSNGLSSYQGIKAAFKELAQDKSIKLWGIDANTPGGMAYQCFETARFIRNLADENGIKLVAYVDGTAASAGYALVAVAHEVIANPMADVGNIGVVVTIRNDLPKDISDGKERLFITYGKEKRPYTDTGNIKKEYLEDIQLQVNELGKEFDAHVANYRGISIEAVKSLEAKSFTADKALELGLIDSVMEREEFLEYFSNLLIETTNPNQEIKLANDAQAPDLAALSTRLEELENTNKELASSNSELKNDNVQLSTFLKTMADEKSAKARVELESSLSEFSFISDAVAMANVVEKLDSADKEVLLGSFKVAAEASAKVEEEAALDADNADLFVATALQAGDLTSDSANAETAKFLTDKYSKDNK